MYFYTQFNSFGFMFLQDGFRLSTFFQKLLNAESAVRFRVLLCLQLLFVRFSPVDGLHGRIIHFPGF